MILILQLYVNTAAACSCAAAQLRTYIFPVFWNRSYGCSTLIYELVHVKRRKLSPPRMPLAPSTRLPPTKVFSIIMTAINSGLGCHSQFCCSGSTIGASGENVSPPTTDLQKGQKWSGVSVGKHQFFPFFFCERADCRYSKARLHKVSRKHRRCDTVGPIVSNLYPPKLILY